MQLHKTMHSFPSSHQRSKRLRCFPFANALSRGVSIHLCEWARQGVEDTQSDLPDHGSPGRRDQPGRESRCQDRGGYAPYDHEAHSFPPQHDSVLCPTDASAAYPTQGTPRQWGHSPWALNSALTSPPLHTAFTLWFSLPKAKKVYWSEEAKPSPRAQSMPLLQTRTLHQSRAPWEWDMGLPLCSLHGAQHWAHREGSPGAQGSPLGPVDRLQGPEPLSPTPI